MRFIDEIVAFIRARLEEEAALARAVGDETPNFDTTATCPMPACGTTFIHRFGSESLMDYIARLGDPATTLARVAGLLALVDLIVAWDDMTPEQSHVMPGDVLRRIAAIWPRHPDYRPAWASPAQ